MCGAAFVGHSIAGAYSHTKAALLVITASQISNQLL